MKLKACTRCNCKKPESDFRVKRIGGDGLPRLRHDCKACEWGSRSAEAREAKRERERGRLQRNPEYAARRKEYDKSPERKAYLRAWSQRTLSNAKADGLNFKIGKSVFLW